MWEGFSVFSPFDRRCRAPQRWQWEAVPERSSPPQPSFTTNRRYCLLHSPFVTSWTTAPLLWHAAEKLWILWLFHNFLLHFMCHTYEISLMLSLQLLTDWKRLEAAVQLLEYYWYATIFSQVIRDERVHHNNVAASYGNHYNETGYSPPAFYIVICWFLSQHCLCPVY